MIDHTKELNNLMFYSTGTHRYSPSRWIEGFAGPSGSVITMGSINNVSRWTFQGNIESPVHAFLRFSDLLQCIKVWMDLHTFASKEHVVRH